METLEHLDGPVPGAPTVSSRADEGQGQGQGKGQGQNQPYNAPQSMPSYNNQQQVISHSP